MLKNYFKIAWRNLWKQKGYTFINLTGLAVGLASCIIIVLYITHELSYDKHHEHSENIYRVASKIDFSGNYREMATAPAPLGPTLQNDFPEVEAFTRFRSRGSFLVRKDDRNYKESNLIFADSSIFKVFTLPLITGNPEEALKQPNTTVLSESAAKRYFGRTDILGESILLDNTHTFTITGVMKDMPVSSHFHFDFLLSMETISESRENGWFSNNFRTYILLKEGTDPRQVEQKFQLIRDQYLEPQLQNVMGITFKEFEAAGNSHAFALQPLEDIHLYSNLLGEFEANGNINYVYIFSALAVFILLLACINFINLATARSAQRAREVGIRKTLGSVRAQLTGQFISEAILFSLLAFLTALLLVEISLPYFSDIAGRPIEAAYISQPWVFALIFGIALLTGLVSGVYPALMLSSYQPVKVLKASFTGSSRHKFLRKGLVVLQFSVSLVIVVGLFVINKQLNFIQQKSLGFNKQQVIILNDAYALGDRERVETFRDEILTHSAINSAAASAFFPVEGYGQNDTAFWPEGAEPNENNTFSMQNWTVDESYIPTLGMEIIDGRNFSRDLDQLNESVIINEAALKKFGYEDPIGRTILSFGDDSDGQGDYQRFTIVGVVRNFHFESLKKDIYPLGLFYSQPRSNLAFQIQPGKSSEAIDLLESAWKTYAPSQPFSYAFMDERFDMMYREENRVQSLMTAFSLLAIIIASLGLFGLSAYTAERRTKEIGVRKVMGASIHSILSLVSREFLQLVLLSFIIAIPVSWMVAQNWLQNFTYRTDIGMQPFILAGAGMIILAVLTVSWQSMRAALTNPIDSLRNE